MYTFNFILRIVLAGVFILSGAVKLYHFELAELTVAESGLFSWAMASFFAKILLSFELILGLLILVNPFQKNAAYIFVMAVLVFFSTYLIWQILFKKQADCGCFPGLLEMSPAIALIRNGVMFALAFYLYKKDKPGIYNLYAPVKALLPIMGLLVATPFILYASQTTVTTIKKGSVLPLEVMDNHPKKLNTNIQYDLKKGKHIIAFVSLTCPNCKLSTKRLRVLKDMYPNLPVVLILNGEKKFLKPFFEFTGAEKMDRIHFNGGKDYIRMSGLDLPNILVVDNKKVIQQLNYTDLNESTLEKYVNLN